MLPLPPPLLSESNGRMHTKHFQYLPTPPTPSPSAVIFCSSPEHDKAFQNVLWETFSVLLVQKKVPWGWLNMVVSELAR